MEPLSKARIKFIQSLQHKKFRQKYDKFIVEGLKITSELAGDKIHLIEEVLVSNPDYHDILSNTIPEDKLINVQPQQMHQISQMSTPPGVLAVCTLPEPDHLPEDLAGTRSFYLDAIRDPGNLGTILRIADWFGLDFIIFSPDCVDKFNHKVLQASMGSALRVRTPELTKSELLMANAPLYACDTGGKNMNQLQAPDEGIIVFGNESLGVADELMHKMNEIIAIPGHRKKGAESLNVASAAAIIAAWWTH